MAELEISPLAKRLAEENNVDWHRLNGSGDGGKVVERDVLDYLSRVMSGEEDVNPTPEPLPDGLEAWPEDGPAAAGAAGGPSRAAADTSPLEDEAPSSPSVEWRTGSDAQDVAADTQREFGQGDESFADDNYGQDPSYAPSYEPSYDSSYDSADGGVGNVDYGGGPALAEPDFGDAGYRESGSDDVGPFDFGVNANGEAARDEAGSGDEEDLDEGIFVFDDDEPSAPAASATVPTPPQEWADDLTDFGEHRDDVTGHDRDHEMSRDMGRDVGHDLGHELDQDLGHVQDRGNAGVAGGPIEVGGSRERELDFDWTSGGGQEFESREEASEPTPAWDDDLQEPAWNAGAAEPVETELQPAEPVVDPWAAPSEPVDPWAASAEPVASSATAPDPVGEEDSVPQQDMAAAEFEPDSVTEGTPEGRFAWDGGTSAQGQEHAWGVADDEEELADQDAEAEPSASALDDDFAAKYDDPGAVSPEGVGFEEEETPVRSFTPVGEAGQGDEPASGDGFAPAAAAGEAAATFADGARWANEQQQAVPSYAVRGSTASGVEQGQSVRTGSGIMLRRHTELSDFVGAQQAVASELGVDEAVVSIAFLIRAASRAGYPWPLAAGSERLGVASFGESDISLAALDGAADMNFRELVTACSSLPAADSADDAALVVADLSGLGIDEAVLDLGCPLLTLGRSIRRGKSGRVFAALGLSGPATPAQGSRFLQRVGDLLVEPVRLLL